LTDSAGRPPWAAGRFPSLPDPGIARPARRSPIMFKCQECGRKFSTARAANCGCPGCGGSDIDLDVYRRRFDVPAVEPVRATAGRAVYTLDGGTVTRVGDR
jgi:hypothetical protein